MAVWGATATRHRIAAARTPGTATTIPLTTPEGKNRPTLPPRKGSDDDIDNYDPESIAEAYYGALDDGDASTLEDLSHSEGVTIKYTDDNADYGGDEYSITLKETNVIMEDLAYFYNPSAVVEIRFDRERDGNSLVDRHQAVLIVEDGELLVYDTNNQDSEIQDGEPGGTCLPEDEDDAADLLPHTSETFYQVVRTASFDSATASYRGPDGNRFRLEIEGHDSEEDAEIGVGGENEFGDGKWEPEAALLARQGTVTCDVRVETADATDLVDALYEGTACFGEEHVVERSWK